ncbi:MAG: hypothetical protein WD795_17055 [Woeseia sp.]
MKAILEQRYDDVSQIPEKYRDLYDMNTGELFDIRGTVPEEEVQKLVRELADERAAHKLAKARLADLEQ